MSFDRRSRGSSDRLAGRNVQLLLPESFRATDLPARQRYLAFASANLRTRRRDEQIAVATNAERPKAAKAQGDDKQIVVATSAERPKAAKAQLVGVGPHEKLTKENDMVVKITANDKGTPPGKLAEAEIHFEDGYLKGLKLVGFAVWERRNGTAGTSRSRRAATQSTASAAVSRCCGPSPTRRRRIACATSFCRRIRSTKKSWRLLTREPE